MKRLDYSNCTCISRHRWLLLALFISLLLHLLLVAEFAFELPFLHDDDAETTTLQATLVQPPPATPEISPAPKARLPQKKAPPRHQPNKMPEPLPPTEEVMAATAEPVTPMFPANGITDTSPAGESMDAYSNGNGEAAMALATDAEMQKTIFRRVETEFEVKRGSDTSAVGITTITYIRQQDGKYSLTSKTKAKGFVSLFFGNLVQISEGSITEQGLRPDVYTYHYGSSDRKLQRAAFNWEAGALQLHSSKGDRTVDLPTGTQDFLSFMYQFMFSPPLENMRISMTNGKKIDTYDYSFEGEENLQTLIGALNTVHLQRSSSDEEKTEIWLATEYQYLPVKIRKTEKDGMVIEQLVTRLHTEL